MATKKFIMPAADVIFALKKPICETESILAPGTSFILAKCKPTTDAPQFISDTLPMKPSRAIYNN